MIQPLNSHLDFARKFDGTDMRMRIVPSPITVAPLTMACWCNGQISSDAPMCVGSDDSGSENQNWKLETSLSGTIRAAASAFGVEGTKRSLAGTVATGYYHHCGVFLNDSSRTGWINGLPGTENTDLTTITASSIECMTIGIIEKFTTGNYVGDVFAPCFWNVALTDAEIQALAARTPPWKIRPTAIVAMPDMRTGYDPYLKKVWSFVGGPISPANPPFRWERKRRVAKASVAVVATTTQFVGFRVGKHIW